MTSSGGGLVVLLPARNCAEDIPGWYDSVSRFADAVVALDDGSTDETEAALAAHPLLQRLLTNPRRDTYDGWDDAANRNRLLQAAGELNPAWILSLDADERIDLADAAALREFVDRDAIPGLAYGFRVYRMIDNLETYDANVNALWAYRLFGFEPGQRFPDQRLHFVPVPRTISRQRWVKTSLRIQHLGSLTATRRRARFEKYRQADPACDFQADYTGLLASPSDAHPWETRPLDLPVVLDEVGGNGSQERLDLDDPVLSAIVISRNDEDRIERAVRAVVDQQVPEPFEVIVVTSGNDRTAEIVREKFPDVRLIELHHPALPGEARNVGLRAARGDYVSFPGSHVELAPGSLAARLRAHQQGWAMVTGRMLNGTRTAAGWASYFLDHSTGLPGAPDGELKMAPVRCSYMRHLVLGIGGFPEDMRAGEDTVVNTKLFALGHSAVRDSDVLATHHSPCRTVGTLVRHHFQRGRAFGRILLERHRGRGRLLRSEKWEVAAYLPRRLGRVRHHVAAYGGELRPTYRRVAPLVAVGVLAAWAGTCYELLRTSWGKAAVPLGAGRRPEPHALRGAPPLIEVNAYIDPKGDEGDRLAVARVASQLTYLSLFSSRVKPDGNLTSLEDRAAIEGARSGRARPLLVITNVDDGDRFSLELGEAILSSTDCQERLLRNAVRMMRERGCAGLNIDFEFLRPADREAYNEFLGLAGRRLREEGFVLSTALAPKIDGAQSGPWHGAHDYRAHGRVADFVVIMTYEWGWSSGPPQAIAPASGVRDVLRYAVSEIPRQKILMGIPLYGYDWMLPHSSTGPRAKALSAEAALRLAKGREAVIQYHEPSQSPYFHYRDDAGRRHVVWFEDARSIQAKFDLVKAFGLRGISYWRLPLSFRENWSLLNDNFRVVAPTGAPARSIFPAWSPVS